MKTNDMHGRLPATRKGTTEKLCFEDGPTLCGDCNERLIGEVHENVFGEWICASCSNRTAVAS